MRRISLAPISFNFMLGDPRGPQGRADSGGKGKSRLAGKKMARKKGEAGLSPRPLLFFAPFFF